MAASREEQKSKTPCHVCGRILSTLKRCKNCKTTFYCSRECQIKDWPVHKVECISSKKNPSKLVPQPSERKCPSHSNSSAAERQTDSVGTGGESLSKSLSAVTIEDHSGDQHGCRHGHHESTSSATGDSRGETVTISVKTSKQKHQVTLDAASSGEDLLSTIAHRVSIPVDKMKLIHRGKLMSAENIRGCLSQRALFQAVGEVAESEEGLRTKDIECVMDRMKVDRNTAIRALRSTGDVIDAILYLGNK